MHHQLTNKYQETPSSPSRSDQSAPIEYTSGSLTDVLVSVSLSPGQLALNVPHWLTILKGNESLMSRTSTHLILLFLAVVAISLRAVPLSWNEVKAIQPLKYLPEEAAVIPAAETEQRNIPLTLPAALNDTEDDVLIRAAVPHTIIPDRSRAEISTYTVQGGDTVFGIAAKFGLTPETILWANSDLEDNPDWLAVGRELTILPVNGVYHQVGGGDTVEGIAATYKTTPEAIIDFDLNELDPDDPVIKAGQWLVVPGGSKPFVPRTVVAFSGTVPADATVGTGAFGWPASGTIFQGYWSGHQAIDVAAWVGAPVLAADSGHVVFSGWDNTGYGNTVVIDHGNGFQTLYAHLDAYYVNAGDNVVKGQQIADMGSTGNSTGPHLHFEVRQSTILRNPVGFVP
jgi:murein DD-endopeptidase MepM/ murein hydrolase activator NlpD